MAQSMTFALSLTCMPASSFLLSWVGLISVLINLLLHVDNLHRIAAAVNIDIDYFSRLSRLGRVSLISHSS